MKRPIEEIVGDNVRKIRTELGWSQRKLSEKTGVSQRVISNLEQGGGAGSSTIRVIEKVADGLGIPVYLLLTEGLTWDKKRIDRTLVMMKNFAHLSEKAQERIVDLIDDYTAMEQ